MAMNHKIKQADERLDELSKPVQILSYIDPQNAKEEREKFMNSRDYEPEFEYKSLKFNPDDLKREIASIKVDDSLIGKLIGSKQNELIKELQLLEARNSPRFKDLSISLYGCPDEQLIKEAHKLIHLEINPEDKLLCAEDVKKGLEATLRDYGFKGWKTILDPNMSANVKVIGSEIYIKEDVKFSTRQIERLKIHEIGVHVLRSENGRIQPYAIFKNSTPGYLPTEEGLTILAEEKAGVLDNNVIKNYAGRVLAVDMAVKGAKFRETYNALLDKSFNENDAYILTQRAFRSGGFIKDHIYLQGRKDVKKFLNDGGSLDTLFVGQIGINDVPLVEELLKTGELKPARYKTFN